MDTHKILVIDGDPKNLQILKESLESANFAVTVTGNGQDAWQIIQSHKIDIVVSEVDTPGLDGFQLLEKLQTDPMHAATPLVFLTNRRNLEDRVKSLSTGVKDYMVKPLHVKEVIARLQMILRRIELVKGEDAETTRKVVGRLEENSVENLVENYGVEKRTGILSLYDTHNRNGEIYFRNGSVVNARLGNFQAEKAVYQMLPWNHGHFIMTFKDVTIADEITVSNLGLLLQGFKRLQERDKYLLELPSLNAVFEKTSIFSQVLKRKAVGTEALKFISLFDGKRSLAQILAASTYDELRTLDRTLKLFQQGFVRPRDGQGNTHQARTTPPRQRPDERQPSPRPEKSAEPPRAEPPPAEPPRVVPLRTEPPRPEPARVEPPMAEPPQPEPETPEEFKVEPDFSIYKDQANVRNGGEIAGLPSATDSEFVADEGGAERGGNDISGELDSLDESMKSGEELTLEPDIASSAPENVEPPEAFVLPDESAPSAAANDLGGTQDGGPARANGQPQEPPVAAQQNAGGGQDAIVNLLLDGKQAEQGQLAIIGSNSWVRKEFISTLSAGAFSVKKLGPKDSMELARLSGSQNRRVEVLGLSTERKFLQMLDIGKRRMLGYVFLVVGENSAKLRYLGYLLNSLKGKLNAPFAVAVYHPEDKRRVPLEVIRYALNLGEREQIVDVDIMDRNSIHHLMRQLQPTQYAARSTPKQGQTP